MMTFTVKYQQMKAVYSPHYVSYQRRMGEYPHMQYEEDHLLYADRADAAEHGWMQLL